MEYATPADVTDAYEGVIGPDQGVWLATLIRRACTRLDALVPALAAKVDAGQVSAELVRDVVVDAVLPVIRNPAGDKSGTQAQGPFSVSRTYGDAAATGAITFTDAALALLRGSTFVPGGATLTVGIPAWRVP